MAFFDTGGALLDGGDPVQPIDGVVFNGASIHVVGPTLTPTATSTASPRGTPTHTAMPTPTPTTTMRIGATARPTVTPMATPTAPTTTTSRPGGTPIPTVTPTAKPIATPTATPTGTPVVTRTATPPAAGANCLCKVRNINPNQFVLQNVGTSGKGSDVTRRMVMILHAVDAPGATCDPGEFSAPAPVNLKMEDDRGNILIDSAKIAVCGQGGTTTVKWNVGFQGPLNCENGAVPAPKPGFSLGTITSTGSAPFAADYVESTRIKCFE